MRYKHIFEYQDHTGVAFPKWERDVIIGMDRSFRSAMNEVVKFHSSRDVKKV